MKKWVKWAAVAGGALLLVKAVQGGGLSGLLGGLTHGADAPGVELGDVTYDRYRAQWLAAQAANSPAFYCYGKLTFTVASVIVHYRYTWESVNGSLTAKDKFTGAPPLRDPTYR